MADGSGRSTPTQLHPDHALSHRHHLSTNDYPKDARPLKVRWFYAVDIPKWKPFLTTGKLKSDKQPTKFLAFTARDSRAIENAFQKSDESASENGGDRPVLVNEDRLFKVDVRNRILSPVYWQGPIYEVRRGTWFNVESGGLKPLDENIATQIEEGYLNIKPFRREQIQITSGEEAAKKLRSHETWPLYGPHLGKFVVYTDPSTAWILSDDLYGKLSATVFQKLTSGSNLGGTRISRGYNEPARHRSASPKPSAKSSPVVDNAVADPGTAAVDEPEHKVEDAVDGKEKAEKEENEILESEMKEDYSSKDDPDRNIDHLVLCVHGIVQKLGERLESVNFVHDVNVFRKTLKHVYEVNQDLQALNDALDQQPPNCRVQVLPVVWRHHIKFGLSPEHDDVGRGIQCEKDIGDMEDGNSTSEGEGEYATLSDITIEGVPSIRSIVSDVLLDILLYYQPKPREQIVRTVSLELNRICKLFRQQNPNFRGKVSLAGHSLGSTILFDILCRQPTEAGQSDVPYERHIAANYALDFDVENFFALGSPIGLFQMLKGKNIRARLPDLRQPVMSPLSADLDDPFAVPTHTPVSCPKLRDFYNIFHPTDPISYRIEPLVSKAMAKLRPQPLPWTKKGLGMQLGYISGFGQKMATSASSLWSGFTSNLLNKSLGFHDLSAPERPTTERSFPKGGPQLVTGGDIETLFDGFQKSQNQVKGPEVGRLRSEEDKVRALNRNGRIDYAIQEGAFDVSLLSSIASHLGYWSEEDVAHFVLGQLLTESRSTEKEPNKKVP